MGKPRAFFPSHRTTHIPRFQMSPYFSLFLPYLHCLLLLVLARRTMISLLRPLFFCVHWSTFSFFAQATPWFFHPPPVLPPSNPSFNINTHFSRPNNPLAILLFIRSCVVILFSEQVKYTVRWLVLEKWRVKPPRSTRWTRGRSLVVVETSLLNFVFFWGGGFWGVGCQIFNFIFRLLSTRVLFFSGRAFKKMLYNRRFVNVVTGPGAKRSPNSNTT